jgi:hypothetical protein
MAVYTFSTPIVAADVLFVAPMFGPSGSSPAGVDNIDTAADLAERMTNREAYGDVAGQAAALMAAHLLWVEAASNAEPPSASVAGRTAYAGVVTSESVDGVSRSYGAKAAGFIAGGDAAFADDELATSPFGKRLIQLRRRCFVGAVL